MTEIEVTQKHIDAGERGECSQCPIALAIYEKLRDDLFVQVVSDAVFLYHKFDGSEENLTPRGHCNLSPKACLFITRFDSGETVLPFTFEVDNQYVIGSVWK